MHACTTRVAFITAALGLLAGCATGEPTGIHWNQQFVMDQHHYMAPGGPDQQPAVAARDVPAAAVASTPVLPPAAQAVVQGDRVLLVSQEEYARLRSNPQVLGGPPAPAQPDAAPATPATK